MRVFLKKVFLFVGSLLLFVLVILLSNRYILLKNTPVYSTSKHILFLGDSNSECAFNDSIIATGINLSSSSESYFLTYLKLREIKRKNPHIDTVVLAFSPLNIWKEEQGIQLDMFRGCFHNYYSWMNREDFTYLINTYPLAVNSLFQSLLKPAIKNNIKFIARRKIEPSVGRYFALERSILPEVLRKLKNNEPLPYFKLPSKPILSSIEFLYLKKIIQLCSKKHICLLLFNTPKRKELINDSRYKNFLTKQLYLKYFSKILYIDCSRLELPDSNYGDLVHLNKIGSTHFSTLIQQKGLTYFARKYQVKSITDNFQEKNSY
jgi:hypothetical protein